MKDFRDLGALHAAHDLAIEIHDVAQSFPEKDGFGVTNAITRVALAVPRSIARGCGRGGEDGIAMALAEAGGYALELEYLILFAVEIGLIDEETLEDLTARLQEFKKELEASLADL